MAVLRVRCAWHAQGPGAVSCGCRRQHNPLSCARWRALLVCSRLEERLGANTLVVKQRALTALRGEFMRRELRTAERDVNAGVLLMLHALARRPLRDDYEPDPALLRQCSDDAPAEHLQGSCIPAKPFDVLEGLRQVVSAHQPAAAELQRTQPATLPCRCLICTWRLVAALSSIVPCWQERHDLSR